MGGVKVVWQHARQLSRQGHAVTLVYPQEISGGWKQVAKGLYDRLGGVPDRPYYPPPKGVQQMVIPRIEATYLPKADVIIAVGWQTIHSIADLPPQSGVPFYFIQALETYDEHKKSVLEGYRLPVVKIVIARWIKAALEQFGVTVEGPIYNAVDPAEFHPPESPSAREIDVLFYYHPHPIKGGKEALAILRKLKIRYPALRVECFTARRPVRSWPEVDQYHIRPEIDTLRGLYQRAKVFLHTSLSEGWALPVMEALACGTTVVAYGNEGVREYTQHQRDAWLVPVGDQAAAIEGIRQVLSSNSLRERLTVRGYETIRQYSLADCTRRLLQILERRR